MAPLRIAELFAGIGGVTGGLLDAGGFEPAVLIDSDAQAARAFRASFPAAADAYHVRKVGAQLSGPALVDLAGGRIDGIVGCPPCQGLSQAGLRDATDERNLLLLEMRRLVGSVRPLFFLMENVPSLLHSDLYTEFTSTLSRDYDICGEAINSAEYGVPQLRRRAVVFGVRRDLGVVSTLPAPTHGGTGRVFDYYTGGYVTPAKQTGRKSLKLRPIKPRIGPRLTLPEQPLVTLGDALDDLLCEPEPLELPRRTRGALCIPAVDEGTEYATPPGTAYQRRIRADAARAYNHRSWRHGSGMRARLAAVAPGDCPAATGSRSRNDRYFSQAYARLHRDGLARTVTTNFHNPGSGRFTHYAVPRTLTLREALRVQGFPDTFRLDGLHPSDAERLIGNAFPRILAQALGEHVSRLVSPAL